MRQSHNHRRDYAGGRADAILSFPAYLAAGPRRHGRHRRPAATTRAKCRVHARERRRGSTVPARQRRDLRPTRTRAGQGPHGRHPVGSFRPSSSCQESAVRIASRPQGQPQYWPISQCVLRRAQRFTGPPRRDKACRRSLPERQDATCGLVVGSQSGKNTTLEC
jgi:hypothetical protein